MNCPKCNTPNRDDAKFCKSCGHPLHPNVEAQSIAPATTVQENVDHHNQLHPHPHSPSLPKPMQVVMPRKLRI